MLSELRRGSEGVTASAPLFMSACLFLGARYQGYN